MQAPIERGVEVIPNIISKYESINVEWNKIGEKGVSYLSKGVWPSLQKLWLRTHFLNKNGTISQVEGQTL